MNAKSSSARVLDPFEGDCQMDGVGKRQCDFIAARAMGVKAADGSLSPQVNPGNRDKGDGDPKHLYHDGAQIGAVVERG